MRHTRQGWTAQVSAKELRVNVPDAFPSAIMLASIRQGIERSARRMQRAWPQGQVSAKELRDCDCFIARRDRCLRRKYPPRN